MNRKGFSSTSTLRVKSRVTKKKDKGNVFLNGDELAQVSKLLRAGKDIHKLFESDGNTNFQDGGEDCHQINHVTEIANDDDNQSDSCKHVINNKCKRVRMQQAGNDTSIMSVSSDDALNGIYSEDECSKLPDSFVDMALNLEGLSREEKKKLLRESIAKMEEEEADQELKELLECHATLKKKQQTLNNIKDNDKKSSKIGSLKGKLKKGKGATCDDNNVRLTNQDGKDVNLDVDQFLKKSLPSITDIQNLLHVTEKKPLKTTSVRCRKAKQEDTDNSEESDKESVAEESEEESRSESEEESEEERSSRKKLKKGKSIKSGIFAKSSNTRIVSHELYAHAALDDEAGYDRDLKSLSFNLFVAGEL